MNKNFYGNEDAFKNLESYLHLESPGPLILCGETGLGKRFAALDVACHLLACTPDLLPKNPDYYLLDKKGDNIKVEDVLTILEKSRIAALSEKKVFVICNAEKMNVQAQNKLLKLLEDKNKTNIVILLCNQDCLLTTIKSRCCTIVFHGLTFEEMRLYLSKNDVPEKDISLVSYLCNCCPYNLKQVMQYYPSIKETYQALLRIDKKENIFNVCHLLQEKDPTNFYESHLKHYAESLQMFQHLFFTLLMIKLNMPLNDLEADNYSNVNGLFSLVQTHRICRCIAAHQKQWSNGSYSKNDFFDFICAIVRE